MRTIYREKIRKLDREFDRRVDREPEFRRLIVEYASQHADRLENICEFIEWYRIQPGHEDLSDKALRARIKRYTGFKGKPGRPIKT
jgi:hypothetical protein